MGVYCVNVLTSRLGVSCGRACIVRMFCELLIFYILFYFLIHSAHQIQQFLSFRQDTVVLTTYVDNKKVIKIMKFE